MTTTATQPQAPRATPAPHRAVNVGELVLGPVERDYLAQVIATNRLSYGPFTRRFEAAFARLHDVPYACFCSSGTAALQLALAALKIQRGWRDGDEVIVPAVTFVATVNTVLMAGLKPVLVDVRPDTYNLDAGLLEAATTERTRCIIPVHLLGLPADMDEITAHARRHNLAIIEDSCECMFARYRGRAVGSIGDVGCFSTYVAHFIVTGVGGLATTKDPELAVLLRSLMNHGRDSIYISIDDDDNLTGRRFHEVVDRRFRFQHVGYSHRCTELEAAIGLAQLERHEQIVRARRENAAYFSRALADLSDVLQLPVTPADRDHAFMVYGLTALGDSMRPLVHHLEDHGIETRDMLPLIHQPVYRDLLGPDPAARYPVAHHLYDRAFYVGCHQYLTDDDRAHVVRTIRSFFGR